jgi:twitching motility protein PilT
VTFHRHDGLEEESTMEVLPIHDELQGKLLSSLGHSPLFRALKPEHLPQVLKLAELHRYDPEEPIIRQGDPADSFFVMINGEASVTVDKGPAGAIEIGRMVSPASLGEMALLIEEPRTASVVAANQVEALKFSSKAFDQMFQKIPNFGLTLARGLASRLSQVSSRYQLPEYTGGIPDEDTLSILPFELVNRHRVLPLASDTNVLTVGFVDEPSSTVTSALHEMLPGMEIRPMSITSKLFDEAVRSHTGLKQWKARETEAKAAAPIAASKPRSPKLDAMLERVVAEGASDLHLSAGHKPYWRIDGEMAVMNDLPVLGPNEVFELLEPIMEKRHREEFLETHDTDLGYGLPGVARFRVNVFRDNNGVGTVMRQIPSKVLTFEQLALPQILKTFCDMPKGLVLVTGPTGSGKSTTLAAMIDYINKNYASHITTMEDPIEFVHVSQKALVNQREVGGHTTSFARSLKAVLREDPDIVLVGELRDLETIAMALETANTGHLVFGTLHTNSATSTVDRIIDQFPAGQQAQIRSVLADVLKGVVSQTLVRKKGGGRMAALEVLVVSFAAANLIREAKIHQLTSVMQSGKGQGNQLLNDELARLVDERKLDMEEAVSAAVDKDDLIRRYRHGLTLATNPPTLDAFRVMNVNPDTPGAAAGFQRGDLIVEINKKPATDYTLDEVRMMLRTDGMYTFQVIDRAGSKKREIKMELRRLF